MSNKTEMDEDDKLIEVRLKLGQQIVKENDVLGEDGWSLSSAEQQSILLSLLSDGKEVHNDDIDLVMSKFDDAKRQWLRMRAMLEFPISFLVEDGQLMVTLGNHAKKIIEANPHLKEQLESMTSVSS